MWDKVTRLHVYVVLAGGAIVFGAAGWLLGPLWAIAGVIAGPVIAVITFAGVLTFVVPDTETLLDKGKSAEALSQLRYEIPSYRMLARAWPSQFRDALAGMLIIRAETLHALGQDESGQRSADEAVAIYQDLAAARPAKYGPALAGMLDRQSRLLAARGDQAEAIAAMETAVRLYRNLAAAGTGTYRAALAEGLTCLASWLAELDKDNEAIAAAHEATGIYWHQLPWPELPPGAAQAALLEGRLLGRQGRGHEAAKLLARGWHLAASQQQLDALTEATPALKATYHADPHDFTTVWHAETGTEPPDWLTHQAPA